MCMCVTVCLFLYRDCLVAQTERINTSTIMTTAELISFSLQRIEDLESQEIQVTKSDLAQTLLPFALDYPLLALI